MKLNNIINIIESVAPLSHQEAWDNSGLQIGDKEASVSSVLLCTDVTDAIVEEAIANGCDLIISHHPVLFHGLKTIQGQSIPERVVMECIRHRIAVYSSHTPMDVYLHGVSGRMARKMGMIDYRILHPTVSETVGLGVVGELPTPMPFDELLQKVKTLFGASAVRYIAPAQENMMVKRVAMCGGAGADMVEDAIRAGAEVYISADWRHHELLECVGRIVVMDIGHFESEQFTKEVFAQLLIEHDADAELEILLAQNDHSPIQVI